MSSIHDPLVGLLLALLLGKGVVRGWDLIVLGLLLVGRERHLSNRHFWSVVLRWLRLGVYHAWSTLAHSLLRQPVALLGWRSKGLQVQDLGLVLNQRRSYSAATLALLRVEGHHARNCLEQEITIFLFEGPEESVETVPLYLERILTVD